MEYKKGFTTTMMIFFFIFAAFFIAIILGVFSYGTAKVQTAFQSINNLSIGNVSFTDTYYTTLDVGLTSIIKQYSFMSLALLIGMIGVMLIMSYKVEQKNRLLIPLDIVIIVVGFIVSVYLTNAFNNYINANADLFAIYSNSHSLSSTFILNLPIIEPIVGILIMIITYGTVKKKEPNIGVYSG